MSFKTFEWKKGAGVPLEEFLDRSLETVRSGSHVEEIKPRRRSHKKSKRGCSMCKRRHVRCDESVPRCFNCIKGNRVCNYAVQEYDEGSEVVPLVDGYPDHSTATEIGQLKKNHSSSNLSQKVQFLESTSTSVEATPKRKLSSGSLDPYGTSLVHLTPSMRAQLSYCKQQVFVHTVL